MANTKIRQLKIKDSTYDVALPNDQVDKLIIGTGNLSSNGSLAGGTTDKSLVSGILGPVAAAITSLSAANAGGTMSMAYGANCNTYAPGTMAIGMNISAGCKGFYFSSIDTTAKTITLSTKQRSASWPSDINLTSAGGGYNWASGDVITIFNDTCFACCATIKSISGNVITLNEALPFTSKASISLLDAMPHDGTVVNNSKPYAGVVELGFGSVAMGGGYNTTNQANRATGLLSYAFGYGHIAAGNFSTALGRENKAGQCALAIGQNCSALGVHSFAGGHNSETSVKANKGFAFGGEAKAQEDYAVAFGLRSYAKGYNAFSCGVDSTASGKHSVIFGNTNTASANYAVAIGTENTASGSYAFVEGYKNNVTDIASVALGSSNNISGSYSFAAGSANEVSASYALAIGHENKAISGGLIACGYTNQATKDFAVAIGTGNIATHDYALALGYDNQTKGDYAVTIGTTNTAIGEHSVVIGHKNSAVLGTNMTVVGGSTNVIDGLYSCEYSFIGGGHGNTVSGPYSAIIGGKSNIVNGDYSIALGEHSSVAGSHAFACGEYARASGKGAVCFGTLYDANGNTSDPTPQDPSGKAFTPVGATGNYSFVAGEWNSATDTGAVALGGRNQSTSTYSFVTGYRNLANSNAKNAFITGKQNTVNGPWSITGGAYNTNNGEGSIVVGASIKNNSAINSALFGYGHTGTGDRNLLAGTSNTVSAGNNVVLLGNNLTGNSSTANTTSQVVIGQYNNTPTTSAVFVVGTGSNANNKWNTLVVNNKDVTISNNLNVSTINGKTPFTISTAIHPKRLVTITGTIPNEENSSGTRQGFVNESALSRESKEIPWTISFKYEGPYWYETGTNQSLANFLAKTLQMNVGGCIAVECTIGAFERVYTTAGDYYENPDPDTIVAYITLASASACTITFNDNIVCELEDSMGDYYEDHVVSVEYSAVGESIRCDITAL